MNGYTPTTEEVRGDYAHFQVPGGTDPVTGEFAEGLAEFDRWLAEVERVAAEKALLDAADAHEAVAGKDSYGGAWLRARAEAYRQERKEQ
jgi:hypothetical protein